MSKINRKMPIYLMEHLIKVIHTLEKTNDTVAIKRVMFVLRWAGSEYAEWRFQSNRQGNRDE